MHTHLARGPPGGAWVWAQPTGKEEDVEVGLVYFGKRYLNTSLQRWVSADPLEVHSAGQADANLYAYVSGQALKNIDPLGLAEDEGLGMSFVAEGVDPEDEAAQSMSMESAQEALKVLQSVPAPTHERAKSEPAPEWRAEGRKDCHGGCELNAPSPEAASAFWGFVKGTAWMVGGAVCVGATGGASCGAVFGGLLTGEAASSSTAPEEARGSADASSAYLSALMGTGMRAGATATGSAGGTTSQGATATAEGMAARGAPGAIEKVGSVLNTVDDVLANPKLLRGLKPQDVMLRLQGEVPSGWQVETLGKGAHKGQGWVLRQYGPKGPTGPQLRWHPGGGHHGPDPYWRVIGPNSNSGIIQ